MSKNQEKKENQNKKQIDQIQIDKLDVDNKDVLSTNRRGKELMNITVDKLFENEVVGTKALRSNLTSYLSKAVNNLQEVLTGNTLVKEAKTVSIISTELLEEVLEAYKFNTIIGKDLETGLYEITVSEIDAAACAQTREEAIEILIDNIVALTEDYDENIELYKQIANTRKMLPYYWRIKHCKDKAALIKVLGLEN